MFIENSIVKCAGLMILYGKWQISYNTFMLAILFLTIVFYALIWIKIKLLKRSEASKFYAKINIYFLKKKENILRFKKNFKKIK